MYKTFCYGQRTGNAARERNVQRCFDRLRDLNAGPWGCHTLTEGSCRCTVDSSYIWNWYQTFGEARQNLYQQCGGFTNSIMERYEGKMYLTATCN